MAMERFQDKALIGLITALVGIIVFLYLDDRTEFKEFMKDHRKTVEGVSGDLRDIRGDIKEIRMKQEGLKEDSARTDANVSRLWQKYSELRNGKR